MGISSWFNARTERDSPPPEATAVEFPRLPEIEAAANPMASRDENRAFSTILERGTASKVHVTETTALNYSAVYGCIRIISETIGCLPWHVYERNGDDRIAVPDHPLEEILHVEPNPEMTAQVFRETLQAHVLGWGNAYMEIERARNGEVVALWPMEPDRCSPMRDRDGSLYYEYQNPDGRRLELSPDRVLHLRGLAFDGIRGYSPIRLARESIGLGIAMERFGGSFFGNGTRLSGVLETAATLDEKARKNLKESWSNAYSGLSNAHKAALLEQGVTFKQMSVNPDEAQFLESRQFQVTEICRWFRVPPHKMAELSKATFSNIEQQSQEFVTDTILPWVTRWEQEINIKLFPRIGRTKRKLFSKMNLNAMMRADSAGRSEYYKTMSSTGTLSINEIRRLEDMNGIGPEGDTRLVPMNMITLENAKKNLPKQQDATTPPPPEPTRK